MNRKQKGNLNVDLTDIKNDLEDITTDKPTNKDLITKNKSKKTSLSNKQRNKEL